MLELVGHSGLQGDDLAFALDELLREIDVAPADRDGRRSSALYMAEVALHVCTGAPLDDDLRAALPVLGPYLEIWASHALAETLAVVGKADQADKVARFGLEAPGAGTSRSAPRLWFLCAELARRASRWSDAEELLDEMEAAIRPDEELAKDATALADNHEYRARLYIARGQILLELGVLDRCGEQAAAGEVEAGLSGRASPILAARLLAVDRALMGDDPATAARLARDSVDDERFAEGRALLLSAAGRAEIEVARDERDPARRRETIDRARAALAEARDAGLPVPEVLAGDLALSDLELSLADAPPARAHLEHAEATLGGKSLAAGTRDAVLLALSRWRLAVLEDAPTELRSRTRDELFAAYASLLERWKDTPRRPGGIGFLQVGWRTQVVDEVIGAELDTAPGRAGIQRAITRVLEVQALGTVAREKELGSVSLDEVREELLAKSRGLLLLFPARDRSHLFLIDGSGVVHRLLAGREELLELVGRVAGPLSRLGGAPDAVALRALHDALLTPELVARLAKLSELWVVGFEALGVPFGLLAAEGAPCWSERLACSVVPSAALGLELVRRPRATPAGREDLVLVVAATPPARLELAPLPFGDRDRKRLVDPFHGRRVELLEGPDATLAGLVERRALLASARIVHFLAHGTKVPGLESEAALALNVRGDASECMLDAAALADLAFDGVVVLSACKAGRAPPRPGDDRLVHLGGALLAAGARAVVLTRFPVDYAPTLELMGELHARLAAGDPTAEALRRAQASMGERAAANPALRTFEVLGAGFEAP